MTAAVLPQAKQQFFTTAGIPAVGYKLATFDAGTTNPRTTWSDAGQTAPNTNPIILDARGEAVIFWSGAYKVQLQDTTGAVIWTVDNVNSLLSAISQSLIPGTDNVFDLGSAAFSWHQLYLGANHSPAVDASGNIGYWIRTAAEVAAGVTPANYAYEPGDIRRYGAVGDGVTDDTAAIQRAVSVAQVAGGTATFPSGGFKWGIGSQITVSSLFPVNLIGNMSGNPNATTNSSYLKPLNNIVGDMIRYVSPTATPNDGGGGIIRGLSFYDETPRVKTMNAALGLDAFSGSKVEDCYFHHLKGAAIRAGFAVMSDFVGLVVRYCGAAGLPAFNHPVVVGNVLQSCIISRSRFEVCYDAAYISILLNVNTDCNKIIGCGFEADTTIAASNQQFLNIAAGAGSIVGNHFNRNTGVQVVISGSDNAITGNTFQGGAYATTGLTVSGSHNAITGNTFRSARTGYEVEITGATNSFTGNTLYICGAIRATGAKNVISNNTLDSLSCTTAVLGAGEDFWISDGVTSGTIISNNVLSNNGGTIFTVGGIRVKGVGPSVHGNFFDAFNGAGNGAICIRCETGNVNCGGNTEINSTTIFSPSGAGALAGEFFSNYPTGASAAPLTGTAVYDPPNLADGAGVTTTVTVTGALLGDFAQAGFSLDLQGITVTAWVSAANTVSVRFQNESGGAIDLASGTLKARVAHR